MGYIGGIGYFPQKQDKYFNVSILSNYLKHLIGIDNVADLTLVHYLADCLLWKTVPLSTMRAIEHVHMKHTVCFLAGPIGYDIKIEKPMLFCHVHTPTRPLEITLVKQNICETVTRVWVKHGLIHRDNDKPSIVVNFDKQIFQNKNERFLLYYFTFPFNITSTFTPTGFIEEHWFRRGKYHRGKDKPAIVCEHEKWWYQYGKLHRLYGPAYINTETGENLWYNRGELIKIQK